MTDLTRVTACKTKPEAAQTAGYWKGLGYHVAVTGPTDAIRLDNGEGSIEWESGEAADWYLVVASKAALEVIAAGT
jgi:hypothetical protein